MDFIETYDNALDSGICRKIIDRFESHDAVKPGRIGHGVDQGKKDSLDLQITSRPEWRDLHTHLMDVTIHHLIRYIRKYSYVMTGAVSLSMPDPITGQLQPLTAEQIAGEDDLEIGKLMKNVFRPGSINLQKYRAGVGGYHFWHSEIYPRDSSCDTLHRVLLFMFYLNTVPEGGETEFYYQQRLLKPIEGRMVIAPAGFTHTHKGHVPLSNDKYIATSWILFQRAETLYQRK